MHLGARFFFACLSFSFALVSNAKVEGARDSAIDVEARASDVSSVASLSGSGAFSGMQVTPSALVLPGHLNYQLQGRVVGSDREQGVNHTLVMGLSSFAEVGLRAADNSVVRNLYTTRQGLRDLSASAKLQLNPLFSALFNKYEGAPSPDLKLAVGVSDYGGAVTFFRSYYAVATYARPEWLASAGYARVSGSYYDHLNPLDGPFANAAYRAAGWLTLRAETNSRKSWLGATLTDTALLSRINAPRGAALYLNVDAQVRGAAISDSRPWLGVGVRFPLDWTQQGSSPDPKSAAKSSLNVFEKKTQSTDAGFAAPGLSSAGATAEQISAPNLAERPGSGALAGASNNVKAHLPLLEGASVFDKLAAALTKMGFEGVSVGLSREADGGSTLVVKLTDFVFDHSALDGSGVALGLISRYHAALSAEGIRSYRLVYSRWGTPALAFEGDAACLASWLKDLGCEAQQAVRPKFRDLEDDLKDVSWRVKDSRPYQFKPRVVVNPLYDYYFATEYSLLDYSLGLNVKPYVHLWDGGALEVSRSEHLRSSQEYAPGRIYNYTRIKSANRRVMLHHMQKLKGGLSAWGSVGELSAGPHRGGQVSLRWDSEAGEWATGVSASYWRAQNAGPNYFGLPTGSPKTVFARYAPSGKDWSLEAQAGRYWFGDAGLTLTSTHWFGDMNLRYFLRRSVPPQQFWPGKRGVTLAGFEVTFPLTPRKAMSADTFQIKGVNRLGLGLVTPVGRGDNYIVASNGVPIYIKALVDSPVPPLMGSFLFDSDRTNAGYVTTHLGRLRTAYGVWVRDEISEEGESRD